MFLWLLPIAPWREVGDEYNGLAPEGGAFLGPLVRAGRGRWQFWYHQTQINES